LKSLGVADKLQPGSTAKPKVVDRKVLEISVHPEKRSRTLALLLLAAIAGARNAEVTHHHSAAAALPRSN